MIITIDIDKRFNPQNITQWHESHKLVMDKIVELPTFMVYHTNRSVHDRIHIDLEFSITDDHDAFLIRLALGDDIKRLRTDIQRFFMGEPVNHYLRNKQDYDDLQNYLADKESGE